VILRELEGKLEEARQEGDEVVVPGWTAEDSRRGIRALSDLFGAAIYFDTQHKPTDSRRRNELALEFLSSPDRLVRIGSLMPLLTGYARPQPNTPRFAEVREALKKMVRGEDAHERASATFTCVVSGYFRHQAEDLLEEVMESGLEDEAPEVRFTAVLGALNNRRVRARYPQYARLLEDPTAAVRVAARMAQMFGATRRNDPASLAESLRGVISDPNPIARSFAMPFLAMFGRRDRYREELKGVVEQVDDPWVRLWADPVRAAANRDFVGIFTSMGRLLRSEKPSHRTLAALGLFLGRFVGFRAVPGDFELPAVAAYRDSKQPIVSLAAWSATSPQTTDEAVLAEMTKILRSGPEHKRLGILAASFFPLQEEIPDGFLAALRQTMDSPVYLERYLATQAVSRGMSFDQTLVFMRDELEQGDVESARMILGGVRSSLYRGGQDERAERVRKLTEIVLRKGDPELQAHYLQRFSHLLYHHGKGEDQPFDLVFQLAHPEALLRLFENGRISSHYVRQSFPALGERVRAALDREDPRAGTMMVKVVTAMFSSGRVHLRGLPDEAEMAAHQLLTDAVEATLADGGEKRRAGMKLLAGLFPADRSPTSAWHELPRPVLEAAADAVGEVKNEDEEIATAAAEILGSLYRQNTHQWDRDVDAEVRTKVEDAMASARSWVEKNGTPAQRIYLLFGLARHPEHRAPAALELQRRLVAGTVPEDLRVLALRGLGSAMTEPLPEFVDYCLHKAQDTGEDAQVRSSAVTALIRAAAHVRRDDDGGKTPAWFERAAKVAWKMGIDPTDQIRHQALQLYAHVAGREEAANRLKKLVLDETADEQSRIAAARQIRQVLPKTRIYKDLLDRYEDLSKSLVYQLATLAGQSRDAEGAEEFVIKALGDGGLEEHQRRSICYSLRLPESAKLRAALENLQKDPQLENGVQLVLRRWERDQRRVQRAAAPRRQQTAPPTVDYPARVKQLEKESEWKKADLADKNLTWFAPKGGGIAIADAHRQRVVSPSKLLGHENVRINGIAFGKEKVWLAASIGLVAWDREMRFWSLVPTGEGLGMPVKAVEMKDGTLCVTVRGEDGKETTWERTTEGDWKRMEAAAEK
jgi:hypothetical protein